MKGLREIKHYYDNHVFKKLEGFIYGNERVERAWEEMNSWLFRTPLNILEIGCGIGDLTWRISQKYPNSSVLGFDISDTSIGIAKKVFTGKNLNFIQADDISLLQQSINGYDLIFLIDVFEHIPVELRINLYRFINSNANKNAIIFMSCPTKSHQDWLKQNKPDGLQPIDENITINEIIEFSTQTEKNILFYKEVSVWNGGDYLHAVFGSWPHSFRYSDRKKISGKSKIKEFLSIKYSNLLRNRSIKRKLSHIKQKLGDEVFNAVIRR